MKIIIITPTRNEEKTIRTTIECMIKQTILPAKWVIVNDGSTDETEKIVLEYYNEKYPFIEYVKLADRGYRKPGKGVVEVFYEGLKKVGQIEYDIIAKFDGDLEFPPDVLEKISQAFNDDPILGITGGDIYERNKEQGPYEKLYYPEGYVCGPNKFYRKKCFEDINGLIFRSGWDGVDIIRANMKGWKTRALGSLKIYHLKNTGMAIGEGLIKACEKYGDVSYYMGGYIWYFALRIIGRSLESRNLKIGYYMLKGYMKSFRGKKGRESEEFRAFLKNKQKEHIASLFAKIFKKLKVLLFSRTKKMIKKIIPYRIYSPILDSFRYVKSMKYRGNEFECPFCGGCFAKLLPAGLDFPVLKEKKVIGANYRLNATCPRCFSDDRERLIYLFLRKKREDIFKKKIKLLHIAPEKQLRKLFMSQPNIDYISADLNSPLATIKMDITNIEQDDNIFNLIICNHVLEHITDDLKAMSELFRVLKPGGTAILQVPISYSIPKTDEDYLITDPADREKHYGQSDHVRIYGKDYKDRLKQVGFSVRVYDFIAEIDKNDVHKYALLQDEKIFVCSK